MFVLSNSYLYLLGDMSSYTESAIFLQKPRTDKRAFHIVFTLSKKGTKPGIICIKSKVFKDYSKKANDLIDLGTCKQK